MPNQLEQLGLPAGIKFYTSFPFGTMNQMDSRIAMEDNEFFWIENFIRQGKGKMRTLWDRGASIYTAPGALTIALHFWFNIAAIQYVAIFLSDGTAVQLNVATGQQTAISATPGTFMSPAFPLMLPACCQSGDQYLLIVNNVSENQYWIWDGALLYSAGSIGPNVTVTDGGMGYTTLPTVTLIGGSGSGAVLVPAILNGSVTAITLTNPGSGYVAGDNPVVLITGGGSDNTAVLLPVIGSGVVSAITIRNTGSGFTGIPTVTISAPPMGGVQATALATVQGGGVTSVTILDAGSGYVDTPTVTFSGGGGSDTAADATLASDGVISVTVVNGGTNYTGTPQLTVVGGSGGGATLMAVLTGGVISSVKVLAPGSGYTSTPAILIAGGANNAAAATVEPMPFGVSGSSIETFQSRIWVPYPSQQGPLPNGGVFQVSAPESLTDFATSDGGELFVSNDRFLRQQYVNIRQSNGYLYPFGDSSVDVISNVQTGGVPLVTTFNYQNTDPQVGATWRDTLQDYGRSILFANPFGVYGLYGGAATKISGKVDDIFDQAIFPPAAGAITPVSAVASIHNLKTYLLLMTITDPFTGQPRTAMLAWDETDWFVVSQSAALTYIATQEVKSALAAWGTDGKDLFPLLTTPSNKLQKTLSTKLWGASNNYVTKQAWVVWVQATDMSAGQVGIEVNGAVGTDSAAYPLPIPLEWPAPSSQGASSAIARTATGDIPGSELGLGFTSTSPDFYISNITLGYLDVAALMG